MGIKEIPPSMHEGRFQPININAITPDELMNTLKEDKVILVVRSYKKNKCEVKSFAMVEGETLIYGPSYMLLKDNGPGNDREEPINADTLEDWRAEFAKEEVFIGIYDDGWDPLGEGKDYLYESVVEKAIGVYVSSEKEDFCGPLELDFIEAWLSLNDDYYI